MSTIKVTNAEGVYRIEKFIGLNENPDGDTKLKLGEASKCNNWKITRDLNLQKRPGSKTKIDLGTNAPVMGMWYGNIEGKFYGLAASGNYMWKFYENDAWLETPEKLGEISTANRVNFFAYNNIVYIQNGEEYYQYDGVRFGIVLGYRPLIITSRTPSGSQSTLLEEVNKLTGMRRVWFSPDGTSSTFVLPESDLLSVDYVMVNADGSYIDPETYSFDRYAGTVTFGGVEGFKGDGSTTVFTLAHSGVSAVTVKVGTTTTSVTFDSSAGTITFASAPANNAAITVNETIIPTAGTNTLEIGYTATGTYRIEVARMTNAEIFLGARDNAVFLYGNGTNEAFYSGIDYWGKPRADYFPDLNEVAVADTNTPITGMIRHYSQLICFKSTSAYAIQFGMITVPTGDQEFGFYVTPINKIIGNAALGQVRLVLNSPYTLYENDLYQWVNNSRYSSNLSTDERQAKRISDKINGTLSTFKAADCYCYDDNFNQEYYICYKDKCLVQNYAADAWYVYTGLIINSMCNIDEKALFGDNKGKIKELSSEYMSDDGELIDSYWESGSMDFGKNYMRKLMSNIWVSVKPQSHSYVEVTVMTDKRSTYTQKVVESSLASFADLSFEHFSFKVNRKPRMKRLKIKAKKFVFLKIILISDQADYGATVLAVSPKIRETGYAK